MMSKEYKRFLKAEKRYKKAFIKYIKKEENSFDSYQIPVILLEMLKRRLEYFQNGDNVWSCEDYQNKAIKSLSKAIQLGEYAMDENNFRFEDEKEWFRKFDDGITQNLEIPVHTTEEMNAMYEKERLAFKKWFAYVGLHYDEWSD